jgi:hypothetical protein
VADRGPSPWGRQVIKRKSWSWTVIGNMLGEYNAPYMLKTCIEIINIVFFYIYVLNKLATNYFIQWICKRLWYVNLGTNLPTKSTNQL